MTDTRLSSAYHVLRELVHQSAGWLGPEPRLHVKAVLTDHLRDDGRSVGQILSRCEPEDPDEATSRLLDRARGCRSSAEYLEVAYGELKPALISLARAQLVAVDPREDEEVLRLLTTVLHDQERHASDLPPGGTRAPLAAPPGAGAARDPYLVPLADSHDGPCALVHDLMAAELCAAERAARNSHEHAEMAWGDHAEAIEEAWRAMRTVQACDRLLGEELGCGWGHHPVAANVDAAELERRRAAATPILQGVQ